MKRLVFLSLSVVAVTACSPSNEELKPGNWKRSMKITSFDVPGAPPAMKEAMTKSMAGKETAAESCMSPAEAKAGVGSFATSFQDGDCKMNDFKSGGGTLSGTLDCKMGSAGGSAKIKIAGTYSPEKIDMTMDSEMLEGKLPGGKAKVGMTVTATYVGECKTKS